MPVIVTRRTVLQKVRRSSYIEVRQLVNTGFQVLFHSPPGVLFTFPSQYYALSVTISYLGLEGGPPGFPPDFSCPAVLWYRPEIRSFRLRGCYPLWLSFPSLFHYELVFLLPAHNPAEHAPRFGLFPVRSPLLRKSLFIFFSSGYLDVSVPRVPAIKL